MVLKVSKMWSVVILRPKIFGLWWSVVFRQTVQERLLLDVFLPSYDCYEAKLQATNRVPRPVDRGTATRYGG